MTEPTLVTKIMGGRWVSMLCRHCMTQEVSVYQLAYEDGTFKPTSATCPNCESREVKPTVSTSLNAPVTAGRVLAPPPLYDGVTLENFTLWGSQVEQATQGRVVRTMRRYIERFPTVPPVVVFCGPPGTGKGHIAWAVGRALAGKGCWVLVTKFSTMIRQIRATWRSDDGPTEEQKLRSYRDPDLLVIDEVSRHAFYGDNVSQHLYDVVDDRIEQRRATILTTNETQKGIRDILGGALIDRLEGGGGVLEFAWRSYRAHGRREVHNDKDDQDD